MKIIKLSAITSTNTYLKEMISEIPLEDETVVWAESQIQGRGQHGSLWVSEVGKSLTFSLLKRFIDLDSSAATAINMAVSLAVANTLTDLNIPSVMVKWPNDIMSDNKKIGGILIENQLIGSEIASSIIGIGLNVNNTQFQDLPHAGSMYMATRREFDIEKVLEAVYSSVTAALATKDQLDFDTLRKEYERRMFRKDIWSDFRNDKGQEFKGMIRGVDSDGRLLLELEDSSVRPFRLKQLELLY